MKIHVMMVQQIFRMKRLLFIPSSLKPKGFKALFSLSIHQIIH